LVDAGVAPMPRHKEILGSVIKDHNPYFQEHKNRLNWIPNTSNITKNSPILFFVGCTGAYKLNEMPKNFLEISAKAGLKMQIAGEEWCCGSVAFRCGVEDIAKQLAEHNAELMKSQMVKTIVTSCAGCYRVFKKDYPKILGIDKWNIEVLHTIEMVDKLIKEGKLKVIKKIEGNVTYHDPCHLGRHARIFDAPRDVIKAITKGTLVEMRRNRAYAYCCGAGGGVKSGFPDLALEIAQERIREAEQTRAKYLVTTCPFCLVNLRDAAKSLNSKLEILDLLELVNDTT
jgi:heterodisulfide reductase subunit D